MTQDDLLLQQEENDDAGLGDWKQHYAETVMAEDPFYDLDKVASMSECTGLTPSAVQDEAEGENYAHLYAIHRQQPANDVHKAP